MALWSNLTNFNGRMDSESCPCIDGSSASLRSHLLLFLIAYKSKGSIGTSCMMLPPPSLSPTSISEFCLAIALPFASILLPSSALPALLLLPTAGPALHCHPRFLWLRLWHRLWVLLLLATDSGSGSGMGSRKDAVVCSRLYLMASASNFSCSW